MTKDEELEQLRAEKTVLCERLRRKDEELHQSHQANQDLREGLKEAIRAEGGQPLTPLALRHSFVARVSMMDS